MKKRLLTMLVLLVAVAAGAWATDGIECSASDIGKIIYAEKDWNSYECRLADGTKIEFNRKGNWKKVDCHMTAVPAAIVPQPIQQYVSSNFQGTIITKIDKERYGYDVELSNDIDLKFNYQGALIGMDD